MAVLHCWFCEPISVLLQQIFSGHRRDSLTRTLRVTGLPSFDTVMRYAANVLAKSVSLCRNSMFTVYKFTATAVLLESAYIFTNCLLLMLAHSTNTLIGSGIMGFLAADLFDRGRHICMGLPVS